MLEGSSEWFIVVLNQTLMMFMCARVHVNYFIFNINWFHCACICCVRSFQMKASLLKVYIYLYIYIFFFLDSDSVYIIILKRKKLFVYLELICEGVIRYIKEFSFVIVIKYSFGCRYKINLTYFLLITYYFFVIFSYLSEEFALSAVI